MLLNHYFINLLVYARTPLIPHTAPNPKLQTTQINVDVFLYSATTMDYKTSEGVNREVMQLTILLLCTTLIWFFSSACAAAEFSTNVALERTDSNTEGSRCT